MVEKSKDNNEFLVELAPGWRYIYTLISWVYIYQIYIVRMASSGGLVATWGCPKYKGEKDPVGNIDNVDSIDYFDNVENIDSVNNVDNVDHNANICQ